MIENENNKQIPIFVVSPGRTGSTFLARFLNDHPKIVVISDLFEPLGPNPYFDKKSRMSGEKFFKIMSRHAVEPRKRFWKFDSNVERLFYPENEELVSLMMCYSIPFLTDKPMRLYEKMKEKFFELPESTPAELTLNFFDLLRRHFNKDIWVERTGGSIPEIDKIVNTWPDAKYVYNFRDGRETAISMSKHPMFNMYYQMTKNPGIKDWDYEYSPPLEEFGKLWNDWTILADNTFSSIPSENKMNLRYEMLRKNPERTFHSLLNFIFDKEKPSLEDKNHVKKWKNRIKMPPLRFEKLDRTQQIKLQNSCKEGLKILDYDLKK